MFFVTASGVSSRGSLSQRHRFSKETRTTLLVPDHCGCLREITYPDVRTLCSALSLIAMLQAQWSLAESP